MELKIQGCFENKLSGVGTFYERSSERWGNLDQYLTPIEKLKKLYPGKNLLYFSKKIFLIFQDEC